MIFEDEPKFSFGNESAVRRRWRKDTVGRWQAVGLSCGGRWDCSVLGGLDFSRSPLYICI